MKIGVAGYKGRVGQLLVRELQSGAWDGLTLAGGSSRSGGTESFPVTTTADALFALSDCVIDFTTPEGTIDLLASAASCGKALVIGTTGLSPAQLDAIKKASAKASILHAANMSVGVNLLLSLVEKAAASLPPDAWDIEIFESHHHHKIDSPSGTALALGNATKAGRGGGDFAIDRAGKRKTGDIGFAVSRGGDVVGEHTVTFYAAGERIELGHRATDRALFARGALRAARWLTGKPPGIYGMKDVLAV